MIKNGGGVLLLLSLVLMSEVYAYELVTAKGIEHKLVSTRVVIGSASPRTVFSRKALSIKSSGGLLKNYLKQEKDYCGGNNRFNHLIKKAARQYQVDEKLIAAIISVESCFKPKAVSSKGARGLMQLIPATAKRFNVKNSFDPEQNIQGGVKYLRFLLSRFKGNYQLAIAAYNAGEGAVEKYKGVPPFKETQSYVKKISKLLSEKKEKMLVAVSGLL